MRKSDCLLTILMVFTAAPAPASKEITVSTAEELQAIFASPVESLAVQLLPGQYHLVPFESVDSTCGNCEDPETFVRITVGLQISGERVQIRGPEKSSAVIHTHAGYGLFFKDCNGALIRDISITGGERDPDGNATDAAIVVKNSSVDIVANRIYDNIGDSTVVSQTVVGIMGICGRENARLRIIRNHIVRNSWDGIALYRDAEALITGNTIDGVDKAGGGKIGGGRGVGIGVTWNARATISENLVKRYWKGIGLFVDANGNIQRNIIEDILTWGIAYWDADKGKPIGFIEENIIYRTGACGASITRAAPFDSTETPGRFARNIIVETGQNSKYDDPDYYCYQCALALHAVPEGFVIEDNLFYNNRRASKDLPNWDVKNEEFEKAILERYHDYAKDPLIWSIFLEDFFRRSPE
ncbi:MAG: hypothetical protein GTO51_07040 [Candidatus Latescibacteria bacterium]|nr:hypothetical protein [Candidatus Latescibacterota bacterium]NIM21700.1 hypothetical protein [Candidatus Latescibacterota bacterium]NIM65727.1 hypothetical protein [Candidatus Latescibacterota bacterium]NIO02112.1 hypothetical protein [Candidatus Latescibacterota bacterium]NIO28929.1 hypothetical protein [Candidatus Latescibacterota bacterium]